MVRAAGVALAVSGSFGCGSREVLREPSLRMTGYRWRGREAGSSLRSEWKDKKKCKGHCDRLPGFPGGFAGLPEGFEVLLVAEGVHGLPEAVVEEGMNLTFGD